MYNLGGRSFRNILFAVILVLGVALSIIVSASSYYAEKKLMQAEFNEAAENRFSTLKRELDSNIAVLASLQAFYYSSRKDIGRSDFRNFTNHILKRHTSIQALSWTPLVPDSRREAYERSARREGFPDFQFTERIAQGKMKKAGKRKEYFPAYFAEPYKGNEIALGFDLASSPTRLEALDFARKTGEIRATARIILVPETKSQFGFIVFAPIYRKGSLMKSDPARWDNLEGFALGAFRISDIAEKATNYLNPEGVDFFIYDLSAPEKERFLYTHSSRTRKAPLLNREKPETDVINSKTLDVAGRKWMVIYSAAPDFIAARVSWRPWGLLLAGLVFTGLAAGFLFIVSHAEDVEKSARDLSDLNTNLAHEIMERRRAEKQLGAAYSYARSLIEASLDPFVTINVDGKIMDVNSATEKATGIKRDKLIGSDFSDYFTDPQVARAGYQQVFSKGYINDYPLTMLHASGEKVAEVLYNASIYRNEEGDIAGVFAAARDITERKSTEKALAEQADFNQRIFNSTEDHLAVVGPDGAILGANTAWLRFAGENMGGDESSCGPGASYFVPYSEEWGDAGLASEAFEGVRKVQRGQLPYFKLEYPCHSPGGEKRWFVMHVLPLQGKEGSVLISHTNITERKRAEELLRLSESKYRLLFENMTAGFALHEIINDKRGRPADYRFLEVNPAFEKLTGMSSSDILGKTVKEVMPDTEQYWLDVYGRVAQTGEAAKFQNYAKELDKYYDVSAFSPSKGNFAVLFTDVTKEKQMENILAKSKRQLQTLFDGIPEPMFMTAVSGSIVIANRAAMEYCGHLSFPDVIGVRINELLSPLYGFCEVIITALGSGSQSSFVLKRKGQGSIDRFFIYPVLIDGRDTGEDIIRIADVTKERVLEQQLVHTEKLAALGLLVSGISHEINNPNNIVIFNVSILRTYLDSILEIVDRHASKQGSFSLFDMAYADFRKDLLKLIDDVEHGAQRISSIVRELRDFSRKGYVEERALIAPRELVERVIAMCKRSASKSRVKINVVEESVFPVLNLPTGTCEQVLVNLIINAVQASDKDQGYITVVIRQGLTWADYLTFIVKDNGKGMDEAIRAQIFDPFFTLKPRGEGTGMGLYISKMLASKLGGDIVCASTPGEGSLFTFTLPTGVLGISDKGMS